LPAAGIAMQDAQHVAQLAVARRVMREDREALAALAK
jgi:hypothetical protein